MNEQPVCLLARLNRLIGVGISLAGERDPKVILERILSEAKALTQADAGSLYTVKDGSTLQFEMVRNNSLGLCWNRYEDESQLFQDIPILDEHGQPQSRTVVAHSALRKETVNIPNVAAEEHFDFSGTRAVDERTGYQSVSFLTVPMLDHEEQLIGVLQLINAVEPSSGEVGPFSYSDQHLVECLAAQAATALTNRRLVQSLTQMLESFVTAIAEAIDDKSPHTGGHCRRVPLIADALARAVNHVHSGPLAGTHLSEAELYELKIAALLHDCGKIITPTHIIDKSARLETVRDAMSEIEARYEILLRDLEIGELSGKLSPEKAQSERTLLLDELDFLKHCNKASSFVDQKSVLRIEQIAQRSYCDAFGKLRPLLTEFDVQNLSIARGTLNQEERGIIEQHVVSTKRMLEKLHYPSKLENVPEIASRHHERMDGSGYPDGLKGEEMSLQARVLGIADVFEALTAPDRPYRSEMSLSKALEILREERDRGLIDPDLYDVFVDQKVYLEYARAYLRPSQLDM